jgi:hypothetical protein
MLTWLLRVVLLAGAALLIAPFLLSSLATDERGVTIDGVVAAKSETVHVRHAKWERNEEVTFRYRSPDYDGDQFYKSAPGLTRYDALHPGDKVQLHYLRLADVPDVPGARVLHGLHALPFVRLADERTFSAVERGLAGPTGSIIGLIAGAIAGLFILRRTKAPIFNWAFGVSAAAGIALLLFYDFPRPTPAPVVAVQETLGKVKSLDRITRILDGTHSSGLDVDQPVQVVGVEFVPAGRSEPVLAIDLIDEGSIAGLHEESTVRVEYEIASPRTAHVQGAKRDFATRNIIGIILTGILCLATLAVLCFGAQWLGRAFDRLVARKANSR